MAQFPHKPQIRKNRPQVAPLPQAWTLGDPRTTATNISTHAANTLHASGPYLSVGTSITSLIHGYLGNQAAKTWDVALYGGLLPTPAGAALIASATFVAQGVPFSFPFAAPIVRNLMYWLVTRNATITTGVPTNPLAGVNEWSVGAQAELPLVLPTMIILLANAAEPLAIDYAVPTP